MNNREMGKFSVWSFFIQWTAASFLGITAGEILFSWLEGKLLAPFLSAVVIGLMQWLVLRKRIKRSGWWVIVTTVGFFFPLIYYYWVGQLSDGIGEAGFIFLILILILIPILILTIAGLLQWLILRGKVYQAGWWIVITPLVFFIAPIALYAIIEDLPFDLLILFRYKGMKIGSGGYPSVEWTPFVEKFFNFVEAGTRIMIWTLAEAARGWYLNFQPDLPLKRRSAG